MSFDVHTDPCIITSDEGLFQINTSDIFCFYKKKKNTCMLCRVIILMIQFNLGYHYITFSTNAIMGGHENYLCKVMLEGSNNSR